MNSPFLVQSWWEAVGEIWTILARSYTGAAVLLVITNNFKQIREIYIFAGVLVLESLPFLSAVAIAILESSRINSFKFWHDAGVRTGELIGLRPAALPSVAAPSQPVPSKVRSEAG